MSHETGGRLSESAARADSSDDSGLSRRELFKRLTQAGLVAPFATASIAAAMQTPGAPANVRMINATEISGGQAVLKPEDLKFLGFVRFPQEGVGDLWYSSGTMAIRKLGADTRIFINGNVTENNPLFELAVPDNPNPVLASAPMCTYVRTWGDVMAGRKLTGGSAGSYCGGMHWDAAKNALWWSYGDIYVPTQSHPTLGCTVLNDSANTFASYGPWRTEWTSNRTRGAFCPIPASFASAYTSGKSVGIMAAQASGNVSSPFGAILSAVSLPDPASTPADVTTNTHWTVANQGLILHDLDHRQARDTRYKHCGWKVAYDCKAGAVLEPGIPFWGGPDPGSCNDTMSSCVWVDLPDKQGLLYFGQLATTPEGYTAPGDPDGFIHQGYGNAFHYTSPSGQPNVCCHDQDDPYWGTTGPFAHYRVPTGWIYNPNDLVATAEKKADLWSRTPTSTFQWKKYAPPMNDRYPQGMLGGSYFDPTTRRIYVMLGGHDEITVAPNHRPVLMVFEVA
jgi:hypothetical protein